MSLFNNKKLSYGARKRAGEKRSYFRLPDDIHLKYTNLGPQCEVKDPYATTYDVPAYFRIRSELHRFESESSHLLHSITEKNRQIGQYIKVMNKRIDCLSQGIVASLNDESLKPNMRATISEGGLSFTSADPFEVDDFVHLQITLFPDTFPIAAIGKIVRCPSVSEEAAQKSEHQRCAKFTAINESDQKIIAKHIIQAQSRAIRANRAEAKE